MRSEQKWRFGMEATTFISDDGGYKGVKAGSQVSFVEWLW